MPEPVIFLIILIIIPLILMGWAIKRKYASRLEALLITLFTGLFVVFLFQWGQYPYVGSYYLRYILLLLLGITVFGVFRKTSHHSWYVKPGWGKGLLLGLFAVGNLVLIPLNWSALQARYIDIPTVDMTFPLQGGTYYISTGGSNSVLNLHHKPRTPGQMYAIDIDKLDGLGGYARGLLPDQLEAHLIFGQTVYSPCDGQVIEAQDGVLDHQPLVYDAASGAGNYVVIACTDDLQAALLHLMQGSVLVQPGDQAVEGEPIGRVGNSGFSVQPHLHFQVSRLTRTDTLASRVGVPIRFQGRFLVRNSLFSN